MGNLIKATKMPRQILVRAKEESNRDSHFIFFPSQPHTFRTAEMFWKLGRESIGLASIVMRWRTVYFYILKIFLKEFDFLFFLYFHTILKH